eukprot:TRINITY_DN21442_c0_g2_i2.p1 TRINITY_DN21442_c0_g2~~TRINITY_DN21442_c0_g2_i2.p1  ORF type:complete len:1335 (+),score=496.47 TRINITY_DN21442_c0_g2_i2:229-4233(+)
MPPFGSRPSSPTTTGQPLDLSAVFRGMDLANFCCSATTDASKGWDGGALPPDWTPLPVAAPAPPPPPLSLALAPSDFAPFLPSTDAWAPQVQELPAEAVGHGIWAVGGALEALQLTEAQLAPSGTGLSGLLEQLSIAAGTSAARASELTASADWQRELSLSCSGPTAEALQCEATAGIADALRRTLMNTAESPVPALAAAAALAARCRCPSPCHNAAPPCGAWARCGADLLKQLVDDVLPTAARCIDPSGSNAAACGWLCLLCHFCATTELNIAVLYDLRCGWQRRGRDEAVSVVDAASAALVSNPNSRPLLLSTSLLLSHFACYDTRRAPAALMQGMLNFFDDAVCVARCCATLAALCARYDLSPSTPTAAQAALTPAAGEIVRLMTRHSADAVAQCALSLLAARAADGNRKAAKALLEAGLCTALEQAVDHHSHDHRLVFAACAAATSVAASDNGAAASALADRAAAALSAAAASDDVGDDDQGRKPSAAAAVRCIAFAGRHSPERAGGMTAVAAALLSLRKDAARVSQQLGSARETGSPASSRSQSPQPPDPRSAAAPPAALRAVLSALRSRGLVRGDAGFAREGCVLLRRAAESGNSGLAAELCGGFSAVLSAHPKDDDVQRDGLGGLCALLAPHSADADAGAWLPPRQSFDIAAAISAAAAHLLARLRHGDAGDADMQRRALSALRRLSTQRQHDDDAQATGRSTSTAIAAMRAFPADAPLQAAGSALLRRLCQAGEAEEAALMGAGTVCVAALNLAVERKQGSEADTALLRDALGCVALVVWGADAASRTDAPPSRELPPLSVQERMSALRSAITAMGWQPRDTEIQRYGCAALAGFCAGSVLSKGGQPPEPSIAAMLGPTAGAAVAAMESCAASPDVQLEACRAVGAIAQWGAQAKQELSARRAVDGVVAAMRGFPHDVGVQQEACAALAQLSYDSASLTHEITAKGGVAVCLAAMRTLTTSLRVQLAACSALSGLAFNNTQGQDEILHLGGVQTVISAMRGSDRPKMLESGCLVLGTLSWHDGIKGEVAVQGGIEVILDAMRRFPEHCALQKNGCRAISQLAYNSEANRDRMCDHGGVEVVFTAMRAHPNNDKLLLHAVVALTYISWRSEAVVRMMARAGGAQVADEVIQNFRENDKLRKKAEHLRIIISRRGRGDSPQRQGPYGRGAEEADEDTDEAAAAEGPHPDTDAVPSDGRRAGSEDRFSVDWRSARRRDQPAPRPWELADPQCGGGYKSAAAATQPRRAPHQPVWAKESRFGDGSGFASLRRKEGGRQQQQQQQQGPAGPPARQPLTRQQLTSAAHSGPPAARWGRRQPQPQQQARKERE